MAIAIKVGEIRRVAAIDGSEICVNAPRRITFRTGVSLRARVLTVSQFRSSGKTSFRNRQ